jgi:glycosyltransferase involved in cell wall biosynthesis
MNILFVVQAYHPSRGGVQWMVQSLAERLVRIHDESVTVYTTNALECQRFNNPALPGLAAGDEQINGVTVRRFATFNQLAGLRRNLARLGHKLQLPGQDALRTLHFGPIVPGLRRAVAESGADIVVASSFPMQHMYDALAGARATGVPLVLIGAVHPTDMWGYGLPRMFRAIRTADRYIALSGHEADFLRAHGIPAAQIVVLGGGVEPSAYQDAAGAGAELRAELGFNADPVIVMLGRQTAYKRADLLLAAMPEVWTEFPQARLLLAGAESDYTPALRRIIREFPPDQQSRITLHTDFAEAEKPALLGAADLLVLPSERESFGIVLLEAWAAGKPVIGADRGAAPTVIAAGEDGLLAAYGDAADWARAIREMLRDPVRMRQMGARGRQKVHARYSWDRISAQLHQLLGDLLAAEQGE